MSYSCEETYDVYSEPLRKARKEHVCDACKETIPAGTHYTAVRIVFDGEVKGLKRCRRCQKMHEHLRELGDGDTWPREKLNCGLAYEDEWGGAPPDEIAALAFALPKDFEVNPGGRDG